MNSNEAAWNTEPRHGSQEVQRRLTCRDYESTTVLTYESRAASIHSSNLNSLAVLTIGAQTSTRVSTVLMLACQALLTTLVRVLFPMIPGISKFSPDERLLTSRTSIKSGKGTLAA